LAWGDVLPEPQVTQFAPERVAAEIDQFEAVGDGLVLTLAACDEEPHCATAMSRHELERLLDRIQQRIGHLEVVRQDNANGLSQPFDRFLERYKRLRTRYAKQLDEVQRVTERVDTAALEKDWEELLTFEADVPAAEQGPDVPEANKQVTLERFADVTEPVPIQ